MEHKLLEHKLFFFVIGVKHTFSPKNMKKRKCSRNGPPCVQNGLLPYQNAYFFAPELMVTSVLVKNHVFEKLSFLRFSNLLFLKVYIYALSDLKSSRS